MNTFIGTFVAKRAFCRLGAVICLISLTFAFSGGCATTPKSNSNRQIKGQEVKYCSKCGAKLHGPFCSQCGTKVEQWVDDSDYEYKGADFAPEPIDNNHASYQSIVKNMPPTSYEHPQESPQDVETYVADNNTNVGFGYQTNRGQTSSSTVAETASKEINNFDNMTSSRIDEANNFASRQIDAAVKDATQQLNDAVKNATQQLKESTSTATQAVQNAKNSAIEEIQANIDKIEIETEKTIGEQINEQASASTLESVVETPQEQPTEDVAQPRQTEEKDEKSLETDPNADPTDDTSWDPKYASKTITPNRSRASSLQTTGLSNNKGSVQLQTVSGSTTSSNNAEQTRVVAKPSVTSDSASNNLVAKRVDSNVGSTNNSTKTTVANAKEQTRVTSAQMKAKMRSSRRNNSLKDAK